MREKGHPVRGTQSIRSTLGVNAVNLKSNRIRCLLLNDSLLLVSYFVLNHEFPFDAADVSHMPRFPRKATLKSLH